MGTKMFDHIIPLGRNCEVGFQFNRCFGFLESFPYNWCYVVDQYKLLEVLENSDILWSGDIKRTSSDNMYLDDASQINFHGARTPDEFNGFTETELEEEVKKEIANLKSKTAHLLDKLNEVWYTGESQLYILTLYLDTVDEVNDYLAKLKVVLDRKTSNFSILAVVEKSIKGEIDYEMGNGVYIRVIDHFAPRVSVTRVDLSDAAGWNNIFSEFRPTTIRLEDKIYKFDLTMPVEYNYLYGLCRILHDKRPGEILEFHFDGVTKMVAQCAQRYESNHYVITNHSQEQVKKMIEHWHIGMKKTTVMGSPVMRANYSGQQGIIFQQYKQITEGHRYNLIILKTSSLDAYVHLDLIQNLPDVLMGDFVILMDHVETPCGNMLTQLMGEILNQHGILYIKKIFSANYRVVCALVSVTWKDIAEI